MKMEISFENGKRELDLKNPKGKHTKKAFKLLSECDGTEGNALEALNKYMDYIDEMASELCGITVDELDELDIDEKNKIVTHYQEKVQSKFDFLKSSLKSGGLLPKDTPE